VRARAPGVHDPGAVANSTREELARPDPAVRPLYSRGFVDTFHHEWQVDPLPGKQAVQHLDQRLVGLLGQGLDGPNLAYQVHQFFAPAHEALSLLRVPAVDVCRAHGEVRQLAQLGFGSRSLVRAPEDLVADRQTCILVTGLCIHLTPPEGTRRVDR
jgi:hypothetical protein